MPGQRSVFAPIAGPDHAQSVIIVTERSDQTTVGATMSSIQQSELIAKIADSTGYSEEAVTDIIKSMARQVRVELRAGHRVKVLNLGVFETREVQGRERYNINTKGLVFVPPHLKAVWIPAGNLAKLLKKEGPDG